MRLPKWILEWSPTIKDTTYKKRDFLVFIKNVNSECKMLSRASTLRRDYIVHLANTGVLNMSQIANVVNCTKQTAYVHLIKAEVKIDLTNTVRGRLNLNNIDNMLEIITRIEGQDYVPDILMMNCTNGTDNSVIDHLVGVPTAPLKSAVERIRKDDNLKGYIRIPSR